MKPKILVSYLLLTGMMILNYDIKAQGGTNVPVLAGVPAIAQVSYSFTRQTDVTYALPAGLTADSLHLMDKYYLEPSTERWATFSGTDAGGMRYTVHQNLAGFTNDATLGHQLSHVVSNDTCTNFYDHRHVLVRHTSHPLRTGGEIPDTSTAEEDDWEEVTVIGTGITRYASQGLVIIEDVNTGNAINTMTGPDGVVTKLFENRVVRNGEMEELNYSLLAVPVITPAGRCVTRMISESYSDRYSAVLEPRSDEAKAGAAKMKMSISPNPVLADLIISISGATATALDYSIFTISGEKVLTGKVSASHSDTIGTHTLPHGIYIIQVSGEGNLLTDKFIKL